jgi:hypothetical protein
MKSQPIPLELCLTSNILAGYYGEYSDHHFGEFYKAGYPVCLCVCRRREEGRRRIEEERGKKRMNKA